MKHGDRSSVAFVGNYLPRRCGIATFTTDLCGAVARGASCLAVAVNDRPDAYDYPSTVRFTIDEEDIRSYHRAAESLNASAVDVVSLQHEYGIFGGADGRYVLALLERLRVPVVTTLHTVERNPSPARREVLERLALLSDRVVVMSRPGAAFLEGIYRVAADKIDIIPHGIPDFPFVDPDTCKDGPGVAGRRVLLSFGLLSSVKGIEDVIRAMPEILRHVPNTVYLIVGVTHPAAVRREGEAYRHRLQQLATDLGVERSVRFHDRFVEDAELVAFIQATDLYITPYLNEDQITSGTLAWAVGAGKAVISTPYWHARELLADGRGVLVPIRAPRAIARAAVRLLSNESEFQLMRKRAYRFGRHMLWASVARRYLESFSRARAGRLGRVARLRIEKPDVSQSRRDAFSSSSWKPHPHGGRLALSD